MEPPDHMSASYGAEPWERQALEDERDWAAFLIYRESAYPFGYEGEFRARDFRAVALRTGVTTAWLKGRAATYAWDERAGAFDRQLDRRKVELGLSQVARVAYAHMRILDKARALFEASVDELLVKANAGDKLTARETLTLGEWLFKNDRLATGQTTENVGVQHSWDLEKLSIEEVEQLKLLADRGYSTPVPEQKSLPLTEPNE